MKTLKAILLCSTVLTWGCENQTATESTATSQNALSNVVKQTSISQTESQALAKRADKSIQVIEKSVPRARRGLIGLSSRAGWAGAQDGEMYSGSGNPDPKPLQKISDEEVLAKAMDRGAKQMDREHALVSAGRRKIPGALDAFEQALDSSDHWQIREMALTGLMEHGGGKAHELLLRTVMTDEKAQLRGLAIWGVAMWGPDAAEEAVEIGIKDESTEVQGMAILAVWALKDRPGVALPLLTTAVNSDDSALYQEGFNVLMRMPYPEAGDVLEAAARSADDKDKRTQAVWSYRNWRKNHPDL